MMKREPAIAWPFGGALAPQLAPQGWNSIELSDRWLDFLHEFPFCMFPWLPSMVNGADGWWHVPGRVDVPFLFSLKASKS